jgi:hypothetical protein
MSLRNVFILSFLHSLVDAVSPILHYAHNVTNERSFDVKTHMFRKGGNIIKGSYLVQFAEEINSATVRAAAKRIAAKMHAMKQEIMTNTLSTSNELLANIPIEPSFIFTKSIKGFVIHGVPDQMYASLHASPKVVKVEPDLAISINNMIDGERKGKLKAQHKIRKHHDLLNLTQSTSQVVPWGVKRVGGPIRLALNQTKKIFVLDSGIAKVSDLNINTTLSVNLAGGNNNPAWSDGYGHGTHVAGVIAAIDNDINVVGVVPGASVVAVRVLDNSGIGSYSNLLAGIEYVAEKGGPGDVANLSLANDFSSIINDAIRNAAAKGIEFAVAAGNYFQDANFYSPASASGKNIYTVSCHDKNDYFCSFSNYGSVVDFAAPGLNVESLSIDGGTISYSGTSISSPHVAGLLYAGQLKVRGYVKGDPDYKADPIAVYAASPISITPRPTKPPAYQFSAELLTDKYGSVDTAWSLRKMLPNGSTLIAAKKIGDYENKRHYIETFYLENGVYQFNLTDAYGDGLNPPSFFTLNLGGIILKTGVSFKNFDSTTFTVPLVTSIAPRINPFPVGKPVQRPGIPYLPKPMPKPVIRPAPRLAIKPAPKPVSKPFMKPKVKPASKPLSRPALRPRVALS